MVHRKLVILVVVTIAAVAVASYAVAAGKIGQEVAVPVHLQDGQEFQMTAAQLAAFGKTLFTAMWTSQEGAGRPMTKGTGNPVSDPTSPLVFPHNFNRISGPDTNSCSGCHNKPDIGGGGDIVGNVFVLGQRFDFATFDTHDPVPTRGGVDEVGSPSIHPGQYASRGLSSPSDQGRVLWDDHAQSRRHVGHFESRGFTTTCNRYFRYDTAGSHHSSLPSGQQRHIRSSIHK